MDHTLHIARDLIERGGFVMWPLIGATVVLWWALGARFYALYLAPTLSNARRIGASIARLRVGDLRPHLDAAMGPLEDHLDRLSTMVTAIVVVAPLAGLLGTVAGMTETFDALGDMALHSQSGGIAGGISQALLTTQVGLTVAIPGLILGRLLNRRQARLQERIAELKDQLCLQQAKGHKA